VGRRVISVSEDVYRRLSRLAVERNKTINDIIEELLNNYEDKASSGDVVERLDRIETMLRDCLDRLGVRETKPIETKQPTEPMPTEAKSEVGGFEDNPWVQILRVRYGSQNA
jgi:predicted DNA-binding protein